MILIMAGHGDIPFRLALSFVPLPIFFFFSGYLHRESKYPHFRQFLAARAKRLLIPYFIFAFLNSAVWLVLHPAALAHGWAAALDPLAKQILLWQRDVKDPYLEPYWFILCLFTTEMLYFAMARTGDFLSRHWRGSSGSWRLLFIAMVTTCGFLYVRNGSHYLPWNIDVSLIAVSFYGFGNLAQSRPRFDALFEKKLAWLVAPALVGLLLGVYDVESSVRRVGMYEGFYNNAALYFTGCMSALFLFVLIVRKAPDYKPVQVIGRNSLLFLVLHIPIFGPMGGLVNKVLTRERLAPVFAHSHLLHELAARLIKGLAGSIITIAGLVLVYVLVAPLANALRRRAAPVVGENSPGAEAVVDPQLAA